MICRETQSNVGNCEKEKLKADVNLNTNFQRENCFQIKSHFPEKMGLKLYRDVFLVYFLTVTNL